MALERLEAGAAVRIPDLDRLIVGPGRQPGRVGREAD